MKRILIAVLLCTLHLWGYGQSNKPGGSGSTTGAFVTDQMPSNYPSGTKVNYTRTLVLRSPETNAANLPTIPYSRYNMTSIYTDGLGRTIQTVNRYASSRGDVISSSFYDSFGRQPIKLLNYSSNVEANGEFKLNSVSEQQAYYFGGPNSLASGDGSYPYAKTLYDDSSLERITRYYSPGAANVGKDLGASRRVELNENEMGLRKWKFNGYSTPPTSSTEWNNADLIVTESRNSNGKRQRTYKDIEGRPILVKKEANSAVDGNGVDGWLCTYFVYDQYNRIRQIITPKLVESIKNTGWTISSTGFSNLMTSYEYDREGRMIAKKLPGIGQVKTIYDKLDRPVMIQDGKLAGDNDWMFTKYDAMGRGIVFGKFLNSSNLDAASLQAQIAADNASANAFLNFLRDQVSENTFDTASVVPDAQIYTLQYFDNYAHTPSGFQYDDSSVQRLAPLGSSMPSTRSAQTLGLSTGACIRVLDGTAVTGKWQTGIAYYDQRGYLIQAQSINHKGGKDTTSMRFNLVGSPASAFYSQNNPAADTGSLAQIRMFKKYGYDNNGRLTTVWQKINDDPDWRRLSNLSYDDLGANVLLKTFGDNAETQKFAYRIWGGLESINKDFCTNGSLNNFFGEVLNYDYGFTSLDKVYPSGMRWKLKGSSNIQRAYGYQYDDAGRLAHANYTQSTDNTTWNNSTEDYSAKNMRYDANGNLSHMDQWGTKTGASPFKMDALSYVYKDGGLSNQLETVTDSITTDFGLGEFTEPTGGSGADYTYDNNGNATKDVNREISSILYNHNNKPYEITFSGGRSIKFRYDAAGLLLSKEILESGQPDKKNDFVGGLEYLNGKLVSISHDEGRIRPVQLALSNNTKKWDFEYDFFIKDHQGNVRSVVTESVDSNRWQVSLTDLEAPPQKCTNCPARLVIPGNPTVTSGYTLATRQYLVTSEINNAQLEEGLFSNVAETRDLKPNSSDPGDQKVTRLNQEDGLVIGPSLMLQVAAGDKLEINTAAMYENGEVDRYSSNVTTEQLVGSLLTALSGSGVYQTINEGNVGMEQTGNALSGSEFMNAVQGLKQEAGASTNSPQAFLNYIMLDENLKVIEGQSGFIQTTTPDNWMELTVPTFEASQSGYLVVFLSNESRLNVLFDNLSVKHYKGKLLEENHYYPYGLTISKKAFVQAADNNDLYLGARLNRKEFSDGKGLNWYDLGARQYDPQIGRWHSADLMAESAPDWTPYRYGFDNPVAFTDPSGLLEYNVGDEYDCYSDRGESWISKVFNKVGDAVSQAAEHIGNGVDNAWDGIKDAASSIDKFEIVGDASWTGQNEASDFNSEGFNVESGSISNYNVQAMFPTLIALGETGGVSLAGVIPTITGVTTASVSSFVMCLGLVCIPANLGQQPEWIPDTRFPPMAPDLRRIVRDYARLAADAATILAFLSQIGDPTEKVYELYAKIPGRYPVVTSGIPYFLDPKTRFLNAGETWKYGTTKKPYVYGNSGRGRYNRHSEDYEYPPGIMHRVVYTGTRAQTLFVENLLIMEYVATHGYFPPGNKVAH